MNVVDKMFGIKSRQDAWTKKVFDRYRKADVRQQGMTRLDLTAFNALPHAFTRRMPLHR